MAPKSKFTRKEMVDAAVRVVKEKGIGGFTAKTMAETLGTSTQPIFTCFGSMEEVRREVRAAAERTYDAYVLAGMKERIPFFGFGMQYIRFAKEEPELYRLLFLSPSENGGCSAFEAMQHSLEIIRPSLQTIYHITAEDAALYFRDLWLVVHSIATLSVTGGCPYTEEELGRILTGFSVSLCKAIKEIPGFTEGTFDRDQVFRDLIGK